MRPDMGVTHVRTKRGYPQVPPFLRLTGNHTSMNDGRPALYAGRMSCPHESQQLLRRHGVHQR